MTVAANEADDEEEYDIPGEIESVVGVLKLDRNGNVCQLNIYWKTSCLRLGKSCANVIIWKEYNMSVSAAD